jgi:hypothetical protein
MHRENDANHVPVSPTAALHDASDHVIYIGLNLSLRINAIVDDHIAVALVFAKLSALIFYFQFLRFSHEKTGTHALYGRSGGWAKACAVILNKC